MVCAVRVRANPDKYVMAYGLAKVVSNLRSLSHRLELMPKHCENFLIQLCRPDPVACSIGTKTFQ